MVEANQQHLADSVLATAVAYVDEAQPSSCLLDGTEVTFSSPGPDPVAPALRRSARAAA